MHNQGFIGILRNIMHKTMPYNTIMTLKSRFAHRAPEIALLLITVIWGGSFLVVKYALTLSSPMFFVGCRFAVAALAVALVSLKSMRGFTRRDLFAGGVIGLSITLGYGLQTIGLQEITSSESAFLTALYVPIVPLLLWLVLGQPPRWMSWVGIALAFSGLVLLTGNGLGSLSLNRGQLLTVISAVAIAGEILLIGHFASSVDVRRVTVLQLIAASLAAFALMPLAGESQVPAFSWTLLGIVVALGAASALIQLTMNWAQRTVDPARATIIYAGEPVWAGLFGRLAGERLPALALLGGALVVLGVIASEWKPRNRRTPADTSASVSEPASNPASRQSTP